MLEYLLNKVAGLRNFIKKRFQNRHFPMKFEKFLRTPFYKTPPVAVSGNKSSNLVMLQATFFIKKTELHSPGIFALKKLYSTKRFSEYIFLQNVFQ